MAKKVKICFFSPASYPYFVPENSVVHGGAEFQMFLLAEILAKNPAFDIYFIIGKSKIKNLNISHIKLVRGLQFEKKELFLKKIYKIFCLLKIYIKIGPDIIINTTANAVVGISAFYKLMFNKKLIFRTASEKDVNKTWSKQNGFLGKIYEFGIEKADYVVTQSVEHLNILKENYNIKSASVLKNGFKVEPVADVGKEYFLWVSRYVDMKRPELFVDLAKQFPSEKFVMICPYNPKDYKKWRKLKQKAEKLPNLTFIEKVPFHKIQKYFDSAKAFVNTSDYEGFPNTFLQAAQGKTPIVSLNVNPDNFLNEYNCGIFCKNNFDFLIENIRKLIENPTEIKVMGENAYRYLKKNHDIQITGKQLEKIIYKLVDFQ